MPETDVLKKLDQVTKTQDEILELLKDISRAFLETTLTNLTMTATESTTSS